MTDFKSTRTFIKCINEDCGYRETISNETWHPRKVRRATGPMKQVAPDDTPVGVCPNCGANMVRRHEII